MNSKKPVWYIYDLDGTTIDSSHRIEILPSGEPDMSHWVKHSTPEMIAKDSLLPLAHQLRRHYMEGKNVLICTAREMSDADYKFLDIHQLKAHAVLSREPGDTTPAPKLKIYLVAGYLKLYHNLNLRDVQLVVFDDREDVIEAFREKGAICNHVKKEMDNA